MQLNQYFYPLPDITDSKSLIASIHLIILTSQTIHTNLQSQPALQLLQWILQKLDTLISVPQTLIQASKVEIINQIACILKTQKQYNQALDLLHQAHSIINIYSLFHFKAITYLNITSILSHLQLHSKAINYAYMSLNEAQNELIIQNNQHPYQSENKQRNVAIAYYNIAVELDYLNKFEESVEHYQLAYEYAANHLGTNDPITTKFYEAYEVAQRKSLQAYKIQIQKPNKAKHPIQIGSRYRIHSQKDQQSKVQNFFKEDLFQFKKDQQNSYPFKYHRNDSFQNKKPIKVDQTFTYGQQTNESFNRRVRTKQSKSLNRSFQKSNQSSQSIKLMEKSNSKLFQNQSPQKDEMLELEQLGILKWSDEEKEVEEIIEQSVKVKVEQLDEKEEQAKRLDFLNKMSKEVDLRSCESQLEKKEEEEEEYLRGEFEQEQEEIKVEVEIEVQEMGNKQEEELLMSQQQLREIELSQEDMKQQKDNKEVEYDEQKIVKIQKFVIEYLAKKRWFQQLECMQKAAVYSSQHNEAAKQIQKWARKQVHRQINRGKEIILAKGIIMLNEYFLCQIIVDADWKELKIKLVTRNKLKLKQKKGIFYRTLLIEELINKIKCYDEFNFKQEQDYLKNSILLELQEQLSKEQQQIQPYLKSIVQRLILLIYLDNKIEVYGITNVQIEQKEEILVKKYQPLQALAQAHQDKIIQIQSSWRMYHTQKLYELKINKKCKNKTDNQRFGIKVNKDYYLVNKFHYNNEIVIKCIYIQKRKESTNELLYLKQFQHQFGPFNKESFQDAFELDRNQFLYSDQAQFILKSKKPKSKHKNVHKAAAKIQKAFRRKQFKNFLDIRIFSKQKKNKNEIYLGKKIILEEKYYFVMTGWLQQGENIQQTKTWFQNSVMTNKQKIILNAFQLDHSAIKQYVHPFQQMVQCHIPKIEKVGKAMLQQAELLKNKAGSWNIHCKTVEVTHGMIQGKKTKSEDLLGRQLLNLKFFRHGFFDKNQSSLFYTNANHSYCQKVIQENYVYKQLMQKVKVKLQSLYKFKKSKHQQGLTINDVHQHIKSYKPQFISFEPTPFDMSEESINEYLPPSPKADNFSHIAQFFGDYTQVEIKDIKIESTEIYLAGYIFQEQKQFLLGWSTDENDETYQYQNILIPLELILVKDLSTEDLVEHQDLILNQRLEYQNEQLTFHQYSEKEIKNLLIQIENRQQQIKEQQIKEQKSKKNYFQLLLADQTGNTQQALLNLNHQSILLLQEDNIEWLQVLPFNDFIITIYDEPIQYNQIVTKNIPSLYIQNILMESQENIIKLFSGPIHLFNQQIKLNIPLNRISFKQCLHHYFGSIINNYLKMKFTKKEFQFRKQYPPRHILIKTFSENIHRDYYVLKYIYQPFKSSLLINVSQSSTKKTQEYFTEFYALEQLFNQIFMVDNQAQYLHKQDFMRMFTYGQLYPPKFLRQKLVPVINILHSLIQINADLTIEPFIIPLQVVENRLATLSTERRLASIPFYTIFRLQANLKRIKHQKLFKLSLQNKRKINGFKLVKRTFVKWSQISYEPSDQIYILELYSKGKRWNQETIKTKIVRYGHKQIKYLGEFSFSHQYQMINQDVPFYQLIIDSIKIVNGIVELQWKHNYEKIHQQEEDNQEQNTQIQKGQLVHRKESKNAIYEIVYNHQKNPKLDGFVQVDIDINKMKNLYPSLQTDNPQILKHVADSLLSSMKIENTSLEIDKRIINPELLELRNSTGNANTEEMEDSKIRKTVIGKKISNFKDVRYLVLMELQERIIIPLIQGAKDRVFENVECNYQINSFPLHNLKQQIMWTVPIKTAYEVSKQKTNKEISNYFLQRTHVVGDKLIFLLEDKNDLGKFDNDVNVVFFWEKALLPIQRKLRQRERTAKYRKFRQEINSWKDENRQLKNSVYIYTIGSLLSHNYFIILGVQNVNKALTVFAWNIQTYNRYSLDIPKNQFLKYILTEEKKKFLFKQLVDKYIQFDHESIKIIRFNLEDFSSKKLKKYY